MTFRDLPLPSIVMHHSTLALTGAAFCIGHAYAGPFYAAPLQARGDPSAGPVLPGDGQLCPGVQQIPGAFNVVMYTQRKAATNRVLTSKPLDKQCRSLFVSLLHAPRGILHAHWIAV